MTVVVYSLGIAGFAALIVVAGLVLVMLDVLVDRLAARWRSRRSRRSAPVVDPGYVDEQMTEIERRWAA